MCHADAHNLESHMEQLRRRRDDARDPVLHQLRGLLEVLQQHEQSHDPQQARLTTAIDTLRQTTAELAGTNDQLEAKIMGKINECVLAVSTGNDSVISDGYQLLKR